MIRLICFLALACPMLGAQAALLQDIHPQSSIDATPSLIANFKVIGGRALFWARDPANGRELWSTDGTSAGTQMLANIAPGAQDSLNVTLFEFGGYGYFSADDGVHGRELWRTDGTPAGTAQFADLNPGSAASAPDNFTVVGTQLFFSAITPALGRELWVSDGTAAGTHLLADINPGSASSNPTDFCAFGSRVYFTAIAPGTGREPWVSDGTVAGTFLLADINPGAGESSPLGCIETHGKVVFSAYEPGIGRELWATDGSATGTVLLMDIYAGSTSSDCIPWASVNGFAFFRARDAATGTELWRTDGTTAGTTMLVDAAPGTANGGAIYFGTYGNQMIYGAAGSAWITDGSVNGTFSFGPGGTVYTFKVLGNVAGGFVFTAPHPTLGAELWFSDGTAGGTTLVQDVLPGGGSGVAPYVVGEFAGTVYFNGMSAGSTGALWQTDGTVGGTRVTDTIMPGAGSSTVYGLGVFGSRLLLGVTTAAFGTEPWVFDALAPLIQPVSAVSYVEDTPPVALMPGATVTDADSLDFDGGYLRGEVIQGGTSVDQISVAQQGTGAGQVSTAGTTVMVGGVAVGTFGGVGVTPLLVNLNSSATPARVQAVLRALLFQAAGDNPGSSVRVVAITLDDGDGHVSAGGRAYVDVIPVADPPVIQLPGAGQTLFSGPPGGPITATITNSTAALADLRLEVRDPDSTPNLATIVVAPMAPAGIVPPAVQALPDGSILQWTGTAAAVPPGTYTWILQISDGAGAPVMVDVSVTVTDSGGTSKKDNAGCAAGAYGRSCTLIFGILAGTWLHGRRRRARENPVWW